jgi:hypothetical protein
MENFISKNVNTSNGPVSLAKTLKYLIELGAVNIVAPSLEFFESSLNGRANNEYIILRDEVLRFLQ